MGVQKVQPTARSPCKRLVGAHPAPAMPGLRAEGTPGATGKGVLSTQHILDWASRDPGPDTQSHSLHVRTQWESGRGLSFVSNSESLGQRRNSTKRRAGRESQGQEKDRPAFLLNLLWRLHGEKLGKCSVNCNVFCKFKSLVG